MRYAVNQMTDYFFFVPDLILAVYWWMNIWKVMCLYYLVNHVPVITYLWFRFPARRFTMECGHFSDDEWIFMCLYCLVNRVPMITYLWFRFPARRFTMERGHFSNDKWIIMCLYYLVHHMPMITYLWLRFPARRFTMECGHFSDGDSGCLWVFPKIIS